MKYSDLEGKTIEMIPISGRKRTAVIVGFERLVGLTLQEPKTNHKYLCIQHPTLNKNKHSSLISMSIRKFKKIMKWLFDELQTGKFREESYNNFIENLYKAHITENDYIQYSNNDCAFS